MKLNRKQRKAWAELKAVHADVTIDKKTGDPRAMTKREFAAEFGRFKYSDAYLEHGGKMCEFLGHIPVDESSAGPESGNMDHSCARCGQNWSVPLY